MDKIQPITGMKIKFFTATDFKEVEEMVNKWIEEMAVVTSISTMYNTIITWYLKSRTLYTSILFMGITFPS